MNKLTINMHYMKAQPAGQGVASATAEQIQLMKETGGQYFRILENSRKDAHINHYHQIALSMYINLGVTSRKKPRPVSVAHVHFLPDTLEESIKLPKPVMRIFLNYVVDFYRRADHLVVVNPIFIKPLTQLGIKRERIHYIPNYVSKDDFYITDEAEKLAAREKLGISKEDYVVLGVGQVQTRKGVLDFIEAALRLPQYKFVWAGGFSFGAITEGYAELKKYVENPPANVTFLGIVPREKMNTVYNMADVLFLPSYNELFPMSILEACNTHIPLVLRNLDLYEEILFRKYRAGECVDDFVRLLTELKDDPEAYREAGEASSYISEFYSKENVSARWVEFYRKVYAERDRDEEASSSADRRRLSSDHFSKTEAK